MTWHVSYEYQQQTGRGPTGWTENFWNGSSTLEGAKSQAAALALRLRNLHGKNAFMRAYSVSQVSDDPAVKLPRLTATVPVGETAASTGHRLAGMYPTTALSITLVDAAGQDNLVWLKGMPDGIDVEGHLAPQPIWWVWLQALLFALSAPENSWVRRALDTAQPPKPITAITEAGVVSCTGHGFLTNYHVRVGKTISDPDIDKVYRITVGADPNAFTLVGMSPVDFAPIITKESYARRQVFVGQPIVAALTGFITKKNVGSPSGAPRGRQRKPGV